MRPLRAVVVIPAHDEESRIASCIAALAAQHEVAPEDYEIAVVLDGCTDGTLPVVQGLRQAGGRTRIHVIELTERHGVGRARRIGMDWAYDRLVAAGCESGLIASTDADTIVAHDWLSAQLRLAAGGAEAIGGLIELDGAEFRVLHPAVAQRREQDTSRRLGKVRSSGADGVTVDHGHFAGASLSLSASAYRRCGGMPARAALEDEALAAALNRNGIDIHRSSKVRVRTSARVRGRAPRGLAHDLARIDWRMRRSHAAAEFTLERLLAAKQEQVALILPAREVGDTIGGIVATAERLRSAGLIDELLVVDANSSDDTAALAREAGATVVQEDELMPDYGPVLGKGDAMWRGLAATSSEIVAFADTDSEGFDAGFLLGILGPLICDPSIQFVKGTFRRPFRSGSEVDPQGGGRVTELMARPLLNLHAAELAVFDQPLAGETAARRSLLQQIPFSAGYGVEIAMLIDVWRLAGLDAMAQVDLGVRQNRHQPLRELSAMAYAVLVAAQTRLLGQDFGEVHASGSLSLPPREPELAPEVRRIPLEERPALVEVRSHAGHL